MFRRNLRYLLLAMCITSLPIFTADAACRSGTAAKTGASAGYSVAKAAAESWANYEGDYSSAMQECLSKIRDLSLSVNLSGSLATLIKQLENKVCSAVVDEANSYIPSSVNLDPWSTISSSANSLF